MRALTWHGKHDVRVDTVPDPKIVNPHDAIIKITATAICGSDLHLYDGMIPTMVPGDVLGHEFMGIVEDVGHEVTTLKRGDKVVVPFTIACGQCHHCSKQIWSACENSNPADKAPMQEALYGYSGSGLFGYSHMMGGYAGGQAEYVRVPFANVGPIKIPDGVPDEKVLFLSDIFPTGYQAAENCNIQRGDTVAIWGCGPVGLFAIKSAFMLGAERVIAIDHRKRRLDLAREAGTTGGTLPAVLNAANEVAVASFLAGAISFPKIWETVAGVMGAHRPVANPSLDSIICADSEAREQAAFLCI